MDGVINVYKEKGFTSHDVVAKLRGILHTKKIGHTGTLDPDATGVLPICVGKATKLCEFFTDRSKTYEAVMHLGIVTDTQDITGKILSTTKDKDFADLSREELEENLEKILSKFRGPILQIPPMYSALKVNGKKLYEYAREGIEVERKPRPIEIYQLDLGKIEGEFVHLTVSCSKGTYIRTLCHDIGQELGCGAYMESLERTRVGRFPIEESVTLKQIEQGEYTLLSIEDALSHLEKVVVNKDYDILVHNGNPLKKSDILADETTQICLYDSANTFIGIYGFEERRNLWKPVKMFY
ncbi:tRNA pseudouridine synthase B [Lachnospiraceae bacterium TWA4]|nr:tRNA pseudouridine synthase B [Lachnospiraceae bacterium TWA4]